MLSQHFTGFTFASILIVLPVVLGRELVPLRPSGHGANRKRQDTSGLNLKATETFLWGDIGMTRNFLVPEHPLIEASDAPDAVASLTVYMPGDDENILSMEQFDGMVTSIECTDENIEMVFEDDGTFAYAQHVWDWVNGADNHSFVMVAGPGDCGNTARTTYIVSSIAYDEEANKAVLAATQSNWAAVAHSYDLVVGGVAETRSADAVRARDIDKSTSIDFVHDLPFSLALGAQGLEARIACTNCSTTGSFDMEFKVSQKFFVPTGASMKIKPKGVSAIAQIKLSGSGDLIEPLVKEFTILEIPISGLKIPGVLDLGPFLTVSVGAELAPLSLSAGIQSGATARIDDAAILEADLLNPEKNSFSGWEPIIDVVDVRVDASISGAVAVFLKPAIELQAEALGRGFAIGINMKIPNINAKLEAIVCKFHTISAQSRAVLPGMLLICIAPQGACPAAALPEGVENKQLGVRISTSIGGSLNFEAKKTSDDDPLFTVQIAVSSHNEVCVLILMYCYLGARQTDCTNLLSVRRSGCSPFFA